MKNRYALTRPENVFLARKRWDASIYCGMRMENRNVTFPQTQTILEGINVSEVGLGDVQAILNMRDAWKCLLAHLDEPLNIAYLCMLQEKVAFREALAWGELRSGSIGISGVKYVPPIPEHKKAEDTLAKLLARKISATELALNVFAWVARSQLFWDGNKRTAMLAANKILIENGAGILLIPDDAMLEFGSKLSAFYESGTPKDLIEFLCQTSIFGIDSLVANEVTLKDNAPSKTVDKPTPRTAAWLKHMRKQREITQKALAEVVGIATNSVANIEQGQRKGSDEVWMRIENYFS